MPLIKELSVPSALYDQKDVPDFAKANPADSVAGRNDLDVAALCAAIQQDIESSQKEAYFIDLMKVADSAVVQGIMPMLRSEDAWLRNKAIEALREMPDAVAPQMTSLLQDSDSDVRIFAINVLETLCHRDVESWLIATVLDDDHPNVVGAALDLLAEVGTSNCLDALRRAEQRFAAEPYLQFVARTAIKRIEASLDV